MKNYTLTIIFLCISNYLSYSQNDFIYQLQTQNDSTIILDSAELFVDAEECIHAIAFNQKNELFVAGCHNIYKVSPNKNIDHFATIIDTTTNTKIWSMTFNNNGDMFLAAKDRIIKITPKGKQTTIIKEDYGGPTGATDLRFDKAGNLYIVYDNQVAKYNKSLEKTILIDGSNFSPPINWAVGIELDLNEKNIFIGDCGGKNLYIIPINETSELEKPIIIPTNWGQYFAKDNDGNIFLTMFGPKGYPEFMAIKQDLSSHLLYYKNKPLQRRGINKKAIALLKTENSENEVFCIIGNKVYKYLVKI